MQILIGGTDKRRNSTKQVNPARSYECFLKRPTNVIRPIVQLKEKNNPSNFNYAFIPEFKRYYYIVDWISLNADMWECHMEVDVLCTYREAILSTDAFVMYSESAGNSMIPDSRIPRTSACVVQQDDSQPWELYDAVGCYVLSIASANSFGQNGMAQTVVLTAAQMGMLAARMLDKTFLEQVKDYYSNPIDLVIDAIWLPVSAGEIGYSSVPLKMGDVDTGITCQLAQGTVQKTQILYAHPNHHSTDPNNPYPYADWRNCEPYINWSIKLPGVGLVEIPMIEWLGYGVEEPKFTITYSLSPITGDIIYDILWSDFTQLVVQGNVGVSAPVANSNSGVGGAVSSLVSFFSGAMTTVAGAVTANPLLVMAGATHAASGAVGAVSNAAMTNHTVKGACGGKAGAALFHEITIYRNPYGFSDTPSNVAPVIGRPTFAKKRLGDLSGFVSCMNAYVQITCTSTEHDMLNELINSSRNYSYGGIYIE